MADWSPELTLNHEALDAQHVEMFRRLSEAAATLGGPTARVEAAVAAFVDALLAHVADEERIMDEALYPERGRHRSAHELFVADLMQMRAELRERGQTPIVADWIRSRLPEWLRFHIRVNDLPLGAFLARRHPAQAGAARARNGGPRS